MTAELPAVRGRILIVEDEAIVAMDIEAQLQALGYEVVGTVAGHDEAIDQAAELDPDLVLMDIQIQGDGDGIEAAERISQRQHTPVVFLTANKDESTIDRALATSPHGYVTKPFDQRELHTVIRIALRRCEIERSID